MLKYIALPCLMILAGCALLPTKALALAIILVCVGYFLTLRGYAKWCGVKNAAEQAESKKPAEQAKATENKQSTAAPKFCSNCGAKLNAGDVFCSVCGSKIQ